MRQLQFAILTYTYSLSAIKML